LLPLAFSAFRDCHAASRDIDSFPLSLIDSVISAASPLPGLPLLLPLT